MKKRMLLFRRKGFTLIECLIAIAVFGAMVMIVFMILTHARTQTVEANKSEEDLSNLIGNVMGDETYKRYNKDHHETNGEDVLSLVVDGSATNFTISYNVVDGNKNFVKCPNAACGHYANNTDFMLEPDAGGTFKAVSKADFDQSKGYVCPKCETVFYDTLLCEDCEATADHNDTTMFTYLPTTGGFICNSCGGTAVRHTSYSNGTATGDASMSVSGIVPNAIRYGSVKEDSNRKAEDLIYLKSSNDISTTGRFTLSYKASANNSLPGTYKIEINASGISDDAKDENGNLNFVIELPPYYVVKNLEVNSSVSGYNINNSNPSSEESRKKGTVNNTVLTLTTNAKPSSMIATFQLVNYKSGFSFEYDYSNDDKNKRGLAGYWLNKPAGTDNPMNWQCANVPIGKKVNP